MKFRFDKELLNLITFGAGVEFAIMTYFYKEPIYFGFMLLFSVMFIIDSFWIFLKKKVLKNGMQPIGVLK